MSKKIKFQNVGISLILALVAASLTFAVGLAASYEYSESSLVKISGLQTPSSMYDTGCRGNYCKWLIQNDSSPSTWRWTLSTQEIVYWYVYCPTIGEAGVEYDVKETSGDNWSQIVNQANGNNQGKFVYIGYSSPDYEGGYIQLDNECVDGYGCTALWVYWDNVLYVEEVE